MQNFIAGTVDDAGAALSISQTVASDLEKSGGFELIKPIVFTEKYAGIDEQPDFSDWRSISIEELIVGRVTRQPDGRIKVELRLWNVPRRAQIAGNVYTGESDDAKRMGHLISSNIYERVTGKKRAFQVP